MDVSFALDWIKVAVFTLTSSISTVLILRHVGDSLKSALANQLARFRHIDGHRMPGAPNRLKSYFQEVNFFGLELSRVYGRIYYVWHGLTPVVILADVEAIRSFYRDHFSHKRQTDFSVCGKKFQETLGSCLGVANGRDRVKEYRGYFEPYFTSKATSACHAVISQSVDEALSSLPVDVAVDLKRSSLIDIPIIVLTTLCYGEGVSRKHLSTLRQFVPSYIKAMSNTGSLLERIHIPYMSQLLQGTGAGVKSTFNSEWADFHRKLLEERESTRDTQAEGIFFMLHDHIKSGLINLTEEELLQTLCEIWLLNLDISSAVACLLLYDLAMHPTIQTKVQEELDQVLGHRDPANLDDLHHDLPYLHLVMKESARMNPALSLSFPEATVKEVTDMAGYQIPRGTLICVDAYSVNHDPSSWLNPQTFNPDRFSPGKINVPYSFFRFGLGPRKCLGYRLALSVIAILTAKILQNHNVCIIDGNSELSVKTDGMPFFTPFEAPQLLFRKRSHVKI